MAIIHTPGKRRSNKFLTERAIEATRQYLEGSVKKSWDYGGGTAAYVDESGRFTVALFGNPIFGISRKNGKPDRVYVYAGNCYDRDGNPGDMTRERLNGLLDAAGVDFGLIPPDTRVFLDSEHGVCYVGRKEEKIALNRDYCLMVGLKVDPKKFTIEEAEIVRQSDRED